MTAAEPTSLVERFLASVPDPPRAKLSACSDLGDQLWAVVEGARRAWPAVDLDEHDFACYLAARLSAGTRSLRDVRGSDLYLAAGCAAGVPSALACFEQTFILPLRGPLARLGLDTVEQQEAQARLREALLVAEPAGSLPGICRYRGDGTLRGWLRVIAIRMATRQRAHRTRRQRAVARAGELDQLLSPGVDPELDLLKARHGDAFWAAVKAAFSALSERDRNVLRLHYVDGVGLQPISRLHDVTRVTVSRWLARARAAILDSVQLALSDQLGLSSTECASLIRDLDSKLGDSLCTLLAPPD